MNTRYTLKQLSAPARDDNFCDIVISALRYALPRHSCMPTITRDYILRHWKLLAPKHWCILRDIREHFHDATQWKLAHPENHLSMDEYDLQEWVTFYNRLLIHPIYTKRQQDVEQALKHMYDIEVLFLGPEGDSPIIRLYNIIHRENSQQYPKP